MHAHAARWAGYDSGRVSALEVGRGLAIVSVIYGHALAPWFMGAGAQFSESALLQWKFGASFMMPFFFFLSGVGWRDGKSLLTTLRQAMALVLIAWTASVLFDLALLALSLMGLATAMGATPTGIIEFLRGAARMAFYGDGYSLSALWFLAALAIVRVLAAAILRWGIGATALAALALVALSVAATELSWRNYYQVYLIGFAFLAFIAGRFARNAFAALQASPKLALVVALAAGALVVATYDLNQGCRWDFAAHCGVGWLNDRFGVSMLNGQLGNLPLFLLTATAGVAFAAAASALIARYGGLVARRIDAWGRNSLNLLIVNSLLLHTAQALLARWIAPNIAADHTLFFVTLFVVSLAINLALAHALARPLRFLCGVAARAAASAVDIGARIGEAAIVVWRGVRVSQPHDQR